MRRIIRKYTGSTKVFRNLAERSNSEQRTRVNEENDCLRINLSDYMPGPFCV